MCKCWYTVVIMQSVCTTYYVVYSRRDDKRAKKKTLTTHLVFINWFMYLFVVVVAVVVWIVSASTHQLYYYLQNAQIDGQVVGQFLLERRLDAKRILSNSFKCIGLVETFLIGFSCDCNLVESSTISLWFEWFCTKIWLLCNNYLQKYSLI